MKSTVKRGNKRRSKSAKKAKRDISKAGKSRGGARSGKRPADYPIAETLRWMADGERLLEKWGAIKSPAARKYARMVAKVLSMLEALTELRKT